MASSWGGLGVQSIDKRCYSEARRGADPSPPAASGPQTGIRESGRGRRENAISRGETRVLIVHHSTVLGGSETSLKTHIEHAKDCVYALALPDQSWLPSEQGVADRATLTIPSSYRGLNLFLAPLRLIRPLVILLRVIRRFRPDLVVAYGSMSMPIVATAAKLTGTPCLWHAREIMSWRFPARFLARTSSRIVVPSESMARTLASRIASDDCGKMTVVPSPIDVSRYAPPPSVPSKDELRKALELPAMGSLVLHVGQHASWKGHFDLIKAFPIIQRQVRDAHLLLVGGPWTEADRSYSQRIQKCARDNIPHGRVFFRPPSPVIEKYYWAADLLVLPSHREPFGRVVFEAIAAGLPAVASEDAGVALYLGRVSPDLLFRPSDPAALAGAVVTGLAASPEVKEGWIRRGRAILDMTLSAEVVVPQIEGIYLSTINRSYRG